MPVVLAPRCICRPQGRRRLAWLFFGAVLARGRRTVTSWIRAAGLSTNPAATVAAAGKAEDIAARLVCEVVKPLVADLAKLTLAIDDTPTQRYGPFVQGAGIHHNPTPGPAGSPHVYGHIWVSVGLLAVHPVWKSSHCHFWRGCARRVKDTTRDLPTTSTCVQTKLEWLSSCYDELILAQYLGRSRCGSWSAGRTPRPRS